MGKEKFFKQKNLIFIFTHLLKRANCQLHNIEGLIFNIKNDKNINKELLHKDKQEYEIIIIKEVFKKIVPTFCQDIIASLITSNLNQKYKQMNEIVINTYQKSQFNNFQSFL